MSYIRVMITVMKSISDEVDGVVTIVTFGVVVVVRIHVMHLATAPLCIVGGVTAAATAIEVTL